MYKITSENFGVGGSKNERYNLFIGCKLTLKMHSNIYWNTVSLQLYEVPRIVKIIESESILVDARDRGVRGVAEGE